MKYVLVTFPDSTDISTLIPGKIVIVDKVEGGTINAQGTALDPASGVPASHTHSMDAPGANTGPAIIP